MSKNGNKRVLFGAIFVVLVWIGVGVFTGPYSGKLNDVADNKSVNFLPNSADSTKVERYQDQQRHGKPQPLRVDVIMRRDAGLTDADRDYVRNVKQSISFRSNIPFESVQDVPSADGTSILVSGTYELKDTKTFDHTVKYIRQDVSGNRNGMQVLVTGQAGAYYDAVTIFESINIKILLTTLAVVTILLLLIYRSPVLWLIPLLTVILGDGLASAIVYELAKHKVITVNGQSAGILPILVFGAGTDYALLITARYRDELRIFENKYKAMRVAYAQSAPTIVASAATVILGVLTLMFAESNALRGLGPVGAVGIACAAFAMLTGLPALLLIFGRRIFWPKIPHLGESDKFEKSRWHKFANALKARPRRAWVATLLITLIFVSLFSTAKFGISGAETYPVKPESVKGQELVSKSYVKGETTPSFVIVDQQGVAPTTQALQATKGVKQVTFAGVANGIGTLLITLDAAPETQQERDLVVDMREALKPLANYHPYVGGMAAQYVDSDTTAKRDSTVVMPIVLAVVFLILIVLLRALVAPLVLAASVILSFAATLGMASVVLFHIVSFAGFDYNIPIISYVFLVALGVDYNIFLVARAREETQKVGAIDGMRNALATTGGVITSAGVVLAGTFSVFLNIPSLPFIEIGFIVAVGVLFDTLVIRSILVPAIAFDLGKKFWWPSKLSKSDNS